MLLVLQQAQELVTFTVYFHTYTRLAKTSKSQKWCGLCSGLFQRKGLLIAKGTVTADVMRASKRPNSEDFWSVLVVVTLHFFKLLNPALVRLIGSALLEIRCIFDS